MNSEQVFWVAMALLTLVALPIWTLVGVRRHLRDMKSGDGAAKQCSERSRVAIGNALQELDRLVARPAIEFTVEAERPLLKRDEDKGGE